MKKSFILLILLAIVTAWQGRAADSSHVVEGTNEYSIVVFERDRDSTLTLDREVASGRNFGSDLYNIYRSTFLSKASSLTGGLLGTGVELLVGLLNRNNVNMNKWETVVKKELTFTKRLPMQTEIADFYRSPSLVGAMDPEDMIFNGFGCRQYLNYTDNGEKKRILVFDISCSLNDTPEGRMRITNHGKFEIKVDSIRFNPYLCGLPNDSLTAQQVEDALRIPFDFERRKNLEFTLNATIYSSWMNEAIQVYNDQKLGEFQIKFTIPDESALEKSGKWTDYYVYDASRQRPGPSPVTVQGDCFVVPRSFIHSVPTGDGTGFVPMWGTGQYRIDMSFTETCQLNEKYYFTSEKSVNGRSERKMNNRWKNEWSVMKRRKPSKTVWDSIVSLVHKEFDLDNHRWVHTLLDPMVQVVVVDETRWLNQIIKEKAGSVVPTK